MESYDGLQPVLRPPRLQWIRVSQSHTRPPLQQTSSQLSRCKLSNLQFLYLSDDKTYNIFNWNIDLRYQFYLKKFKKKKIQLFVYIITSFSWCNLYPFFLISSYYKKGEYEFGCKDVCIQKRTPVLGAYLTIEDHNGMNGTYPCYVAPSQKLWYTTCGQWVVSLLPSHLTLS